MEEDLDEGVGSRWGVAQDLVDVADAEAHGDGHCEDVCVSFESMQCGRNGRGNERRAC